MDLRATFGFHSTPFTREIRPDEQLDLPMHQLALDGLVRAIERRMSAVLIAPAGTGKTALLRRLIAVLPEARYQVHTVKITSLSKRDLCREICAACSMPTAGSFPTLFRKLQERFEGSAESGASRPVLILDEAHELRPEVLAMFRILTNFQMDSRLVLSVVLAGQPLLSKLLARDEQEATARRMAHFATLRPLTRDETLQYVEHRCAIAGSRPPFDAGALDALFELSRGNMRAVDALALESIEIAARAKLAAVSTGHIAAARKVLWP